LGPPADALVDEAIDVGFGTPGFVLRAAEVYKHPLLEAREGA